MSDMNEIIKASLDGVKSLAETQTVIGKPLATPSGVTIIPISKLTVGFIGGGADHGQKKIAQAQGFSGGSGTCLSITPVAFVTVAPDSTVNIIPMNEKKQISDKLFSFIERSPDILNKFKSAMP